METKCEECSICTELTPLTDFNTLPCNHKLCKNCFPKIRIPMCPFCRAPYGDVEKDEIILEDPDLSLFVDFEVEIELVSFLSSRQRRRIRQRRRRSINRQRPPLRRVVHNNPMQVININNVTIESQNNTTDRPEIKQKYKKKRNRNEKKRIITSNNYNDRRNQQNIF